MSYEATIKTAAGTFGDNGDSGLLIEQFKAKVVGGTGSVTEVDVLNEAFRSSLTTAFPVIITAGHVTGGGQIPTDITFGIEGKSDDKGTKAQCTVVDRSTDTRVTCN